MHGSPGFVCQRPPLLADLLPRRNSDSLHRRGLNPQSLGSCLQCSPVGCGRRRLSTFSRILNEAGYVPRDKLQGGPQIVLKAGVAADQRDVEGVRSRCLATTRTWQAQEIESALKIPTGLVSSGSPRTSSPAVPVTADHGPCVCRPLDKSVPAEPSPDGQRLGPANSQDCQTLLLCTAPPSS